MAEICLRYGLDQKLVVTKLGSDPDQEFDLWNATVGDYPGKESSIDYVRNPIVIVTDLRVKH